MKLAGGTIGLHFILNGSLLAIEKSLKKETKSKKKLWENDNKLGKSITIHQSSRKNYSTSCEDKGV